MAYSKIIVRENGSKSRILITNYAMPGGQPDVGVDVFMINADGKNWDLLTQSFEQRKQSMAMSVDEYVKNGRHPMYRAVTNAELLKARIEAGFFGYNNPRVEAVLHFVSPEGEESTATVEIDTGTGMVDLEKWLDDVGDRYPATDGASLIKYAQYGKERLALETNEFQQACVLDLPNLQLAVAREFLGRDRKPVESTCEPF
jgi:hypothetical protein